jgi:hypothetical protein
VEADAEAIAVCVRGVDTPVRAVQRALDAPVVDEGRIDTDALATLSALAVRGNRYLEQGRGAPALPQRMGRERVSGDGDGHSGWRTLVPPTVDCGGGSAYGRFRVAPTGAASSLAASSTGAK